MGKLYIHIQKNQTGHCKKKLKMDQINHVKHGMMDYLKENTGNTLKDNGSGHEFLNMTSFIHNLKPTNNWQTEPHKTKMLLCSKTINPVISKSKKSERIFSSYTTNRG